jgi:hypothetical protein
LTLKILRMTYNLGRRKCYINKAFTIVVRPFFNLIEIHTCAKKYMKRGKNAKTNFGVCHVGNVAAASRVCE